MSRFKVTNWQQALLDAVADEAVGIKIAPLTQDDAFSLFVTSLPSQQKIKAHYHEQGTEIYYILSGTGTIFLAETKESTIGIGATESFEVASGDCFEVPQNTIHQLKNTGSEALILVFGCPKNHLTTDRHFAEDLI